MMARKGIWIGLGAILVLVLGLSAWAFLHQQNARQGEPEGGDIALPSTQGGEFSLAQLEEDQLAAVFFGYTYCPDVCPLTLGVVRQALQQVDEELARRVVPVLITVDPERDTLDRLETYVGHFGDRFIGLRGSEAELDDITQRYGVFWRKAEMEDSQMGYTVDHSSTLFLVDRNGTIQQRVLYSPNPNSLISALRTELEDA
ncbi:SCO family protein [Litchfieldella xinjiangensis]|uniref:SCO family protein n=1 Tax=Litchfieldella xinjiangensis TaxID=1166948 RepID=UPI0005BE0343|nr:SCO family protein [Halomonas xinjiangensis]